MTYSRDYSGKHVLHIPEYSLLHLKTLNKVGNCRLAVLIKDGVNVQVLAVHGGAHFEHMDENIHQGESENTPGCHILHAPVNPTDRD